MTAENDLAIRLAVAEAVERAARSSATSAEYQTDEAVARRGARGSLAVAILAGAGIVSVGVVAASIDHRSGSPLWPYAIVVAGFLLVGLLASWRAVHLESVADRIGRVRRHRLVLDVQTAALPTDVAALVRAVATQRLLTETGSLEPWNEPAWPDAASVSALLRAAPNPRQTPGSDQLA